MGNSAVEGWQDRGAADVGGALRAMVISTDDVAAPDRFDAWRDRYRGLNEVIVAKPQRRCFEARAEDWPIGEMLLSSATAPARRLVRTERDCASDGFDHWVLRVSRAGPMLYSSRDRTTRVERGQLFIGAFDEPSVVDYAEGPWIALIVPRQVAAGWGIDLDAARLSPPETATKQLLADFLIALVDRLPSVSAHQVEPLCAALRALLAACVPAQQDKRIAAPEDGAALLRTAVDRVIRREIGSARLNVGRLAQLTGISRSTLYRLYKDDCGLATRIRQLRLEAVRIALSDPVHMRDPINKLAEQWGFHCTASFNRAFRREYGMAPGSLRAREAGPAQQYRSDFEQWLRDAC